MKQRKKLEFDVSQIGIVIALGILIVLLFLTSKTFRSMLIYRSILKTASLYAVLAVGMTFAIISGNIDLSVGSQMALSSVIFTMLVTEMEVPYWLGILAVIGLGLVMGLINGLLTSRLFIPPFIATLGTQMAFRALAQIIHEDPGHVMNQAFINVGAANLAGLPALFWIMLGVAIIGIVVLRRTRIGRHTLAIGNSMEASRISGIKPENTQLVIFLLIGVTTAVATLMATSRNASSNYNNYISYEFTAITAVVLGGTSFSGGKGSIFTTVVAAVFVSILIAAMPLYGINTYTQKIIQGLILILAFSINTIKTAAEDFMVRRRSRHDLALRQANKQV